MSEKQINAMDLFAGAGGFSEGFRQAGCKIVVGLEIEPNMARSYHFNHPNAKIIQEDVQKIKTEELLKDTNYTRDDIHLIIGGPPCQGFSTVGYRRKDDPRNSLVEEFMRVVEEINPTAIAIENVMGLLSMEGGAVKDRILEMIEELGYNVKLQVLNALDFGVPQNRKRVFFLGLKNTTPVFPKVTHRKKSHQKLLGEFDAKIKFSHTVRDAISDLPSLQAGEGVDETPYPGPPQTAYQKAMRVKSQKLFDHIAPNHTDLILTRINLIPQGGNHGNLPKELQLNSGYPNIYGRLSWDKSADTITANCGCVSAPGRFIHPQDNRVITVREAARLQSFPDHYRVFGSSSSKYQQIGNSVPPLLAEALAKALITKL